MGEQDVVKMQQRKDLKQLPCSLVKFRTANPLTSFSIPDYPTREFTGMTHDAAISEFDNLKNDMPEQTYYFTHETITGFWGGGVLKHSHFL